MTQRRARPTKSRVGQKPPAPTGGRAAEFSEDDQPPNAEGAEKAAATGHEDVGESAKMEPNVDADGVGGSPTSEDAGTSDDPEEGSGADGASPGGDQTATLQESTAAERQGSTDESVLLQLPPWDDFLPPDDLAGYVAGLAGDVTDGSITSGQVSQGSPGSPESSAGEVRLRSLRYQYVSPGRSALLQWRTVLVCVMVGLSLGLTVGLVRPPTYTAGETLYVGQTLSATNVAAIAGLGTASATIAEDYARLISTAKVKNETRQVMHTASLGGRLSATEIPETPEISLTGSASSRSAAIALARAGSKALIEDVNSINSDNSSFLDGLKHTYASLEVQITQDNARIGQLENNESSASGPRLAQLQQQIATLETTVSNDSLQAGTVQAQYQNDVSPYTAKEQVLQVASMAQSATSDRDKALAIGLVAGTIIGFLVGVGAASYRDLRRAGSVEAAASRAAARD